MTPSVEELVQAHPEPRKDSAEGTHLPPSMIPHYVNVRRIGNGAQGEVFSGTALWGGGGVHAVKRMDKGSGIPGGDPEKRALERASGYPLVMGLLGAFEDDFYSYLALVSSFIRTSVDIAYSRYI